MDHPIPMRWDGESFTPLNNHWAKQADKDFVVGVAYRMITIEDRSSSSHRHYFAAISEAWTNLSDDLSERFPTPESLRKYALVKAGFADERSIVCASKAEAQRVAAFIKPMDEYAIVVVSQATVKVFTPKSQSLKAMGRADFQASKQAVLDIVAEMIGVKPAELQANAEKAA